MIEVESAYDDCYFVDKYGKPLLKGNGTKVLQKTEIRYNANETMKIEKKFKSDGILLINITLSPGFYVSSN